MLEGFTCFSCLSDLSCGLLIVHYGYFGTGCIVRQLRAGTGHITPVPADIDRLLALQGPRRAVFLYVTYRARIDRWLW